MESSKLERQLTKFTKEHQNLIGRSVNPDAARLLDVTQACTSKSPRSRCPKFSPAHPHDSGDEIDLNRACFCSLRCPPWLSAFWMSMRRRAVC